MLYFVFASEICIFLFFRPLVPQKSAAQNRCRPAFADPLCNFRHFIDDFQSQILTEIPSALADASFSLHFTRNSSTNSFRCQIRTENCAQIHQSIAHKHFPAFVDEFDPFRQSISTEIPPSFHHLSLHFIDKFRAFCRKIIQDSNATISERTSRPKFREPLRTHESFSAFVTATSFKIPVLSNLRQKFGKPSCCILLENHPRFRRNDRNCAQILQFHHLTTQFSKLT